MVTFLFPHIICFFVSPTCPEITEPQASGLCLYQKGRHTPMTLGLWASPGCEIQEAHNPLFG